ncbi:hypothetical protein AB1Y20_001139 [Prymnesium parvum]|uniref:Uncharacterized protein n=1 Tax=Prymnesium parvum TaxID=97485 RepID=A0AB34K8N9_PRYPA
MTRTLRSLLSRGGCSLVIIGWVARGQQEEEFLGRLSDLGVASTVERFTDPRFGYLTKRNGQLVEMSLEFGVTLLHVRANVVLGLQEGGVLSSLRQQCGLLRAHCRMLTTFPQKTQRSPWWAKR